MNKITIKKAGFLATIQDKGRWGFQQFGMSVAGAMDHYAARIANILVDNDAYEAVIEGSLVGPEIEFHCDEVIAVTGGKMNPKINGESIQMWTSIAVKKGDKLSFSNVADGLSNYIYIAFSRGINVPEVMGSKSTFVRGKLGGFEGRKLENGDEIPLGQRDLAATGSYIPRQYIPVYRKDNQIRVIMGPQDDYFTDEGIETFLNARYKITREADRMGYRLEGPEIRHKEGADIISDGIVFGSIQVPGHGLPIIMMADRATTGGYTKIATVITPDLSVLAQMTPGGTMNFERVSISQAHEHYQEYESKFAAIKKFTHANRFEFKKNIRVVYQETGSVAANVSSLESVKDGLL